ncbi:MAG: transketolase [Calditrichia bacterium]
MQNYEVREMNQKKLQRAANIVRGLSMDGVQQANSGHPGMPMGMADCATLLWKYIMRHNPSDPQWANRDRFVLSAGHGSMLIYSLLHLSGYDLPLNELKAFRQLHSKTPGHPEFGHTDGVETTTGPLGQGISNAVGMALGERLMAGRFNTNDFAIVDHFTYAIASDGDLMEGVSHEAASFAGHLGLGKLIVLYDDNSISIDGSTELSFSEDVPTRFGSYGWHTITVDGHDISAVADAIKQAQSETGKPTLISCKTTIGFGSPNRAGTSKAHGEPLGDEERALSKTSLGLPTDKTFFIDDDTLSFMRGIVDDGKASQAEWERMFSSYGEAHPDKAASFKMYQSGDLPQNWDADLPSFPVDKSLATRKASGAVLNAIAPGLNNLIGGSADLTPSNNTFAKGAKEVSSEDFSGTYIHYGVREHGMGAVMNGMTLHTPGLIPYSGTFLIFSDYMRPSIRLAALMNQQSIYVFTHDSIGLGEDGPTHQPIEQLSSLRLIPNLTVLRPADANETAYAWKAAIENRTGPTALLFTRQGLPIFENSSVTAGTLKGAYVIVDNPDAQVILMGSGSEVHIAVEAAELLAKDGISARVVSVPSMELFEKQSDSYKESVLPSAIKVRVAIEAGVDATWHKYLTGGEFVGLSGFGASAPHKELYDHFGLTAEAVVAAAKKQL